MSDRFDDLPVHVERYIDLLEHQIEWLGSELRKSERILLQRTRDDGGSGNRRGPGAGNGHGTRNGRTRGRDAPDNVYTGASLSVEDACIEVQRTYEEYGDYVGEPAPPQAGVRLAERKALQRGDAKEPSPEVEAKYRQVLELYDRGALPPRLEDHVRRAERRGDCKRILVDMMERRGVI